MFTILSRSSKSNNGMNIGMLRSGSSSMREGGGSHGFGSLRWSLQDSALGQLGVTPELHAWYAGIKDDAETVASGEALIREMDMLDDQGGGHEDDGSDNIDFSGGGLTAKGLSSSSAAASSDGMQLERGFIGGLKPMRDRYLIGVLARITAPIHQV